MLEYLDFDIEIGAAAGGAYPVTIDSPAGEARSKLRLELEPIELQARLHALEIALLRSSSGTRRATSAQEATVQQFGRELFGALFHDEVLSRFDVSRQQAAVEEKGLRIRLRLGDPTLAALPWEYLYDGREADYLSRSTRTPVVRYLELNRPPSPLVVSPPLRVLGIAVSPSGLDPLDVERERARVEDAVADLRADGRIEFAWLPVPTWEHLSRALHRGPWHVFHFIGHGGFDPVADEGLVVLADETGGAEQLVASQLGALLGDHFPMRLAILNSCDGARGGRTDIFSSTAATLVRRGTPAVVAMQYEISDPAAIQFSRAFYTSIADGLPVDAAVSEARKGIWMKDRDSLEWGTPVLHMRARDGALFRIEPGSTGPPVARVAIPVEADDPAPAVVEAIPIRTEPRRAIHADPPTFCTNCGAARNPGMTFCTACGARVG